MIARLFALGLPLLAQALPGASGAPPPPPAATPSSELEKIAFFAGTWTCDGREEANPFSSGHPTLATVAVTRQPSGVWYELRREEKRTAENPRPRKTAEHWGYDRSSRLFVLSYVNNSGAYGHAASGGWRGNQWLWMGGVRLGGQNLPIRNTIEKKGERAFEARFEVMLEGSWILLGRESCKR